MKFGSMLFLVLALVAALGLPPGSAASGGAATRTETTVLSFNIRYGRADDGQDSWRFRRDLVCETIAAHAPAIFGVQECLLEQAEVLQNAFPGYTFNGVGRDDGQLAGEMCAIFTDKERYEVLDHGVFWLSETPDVIGSRGWDAALHRIAAWVQLRDRACLPETLFVFNTHFDHIGGEARRQSASLLGERMAAIAGDKAAILMGDFNADAATSAPHEILTSGNLQDTWRCLAAAGAAQDPGTFHGFTGQTSRGRIDWILTTPDLSCLNAGIDRRARDGRYPSDHYPVWVTLGLARQGEAPPGAGPGELGGR